MAYQGFFGGIGVGGSDARLNSIVDPEADDTAASSVPGSGLVRVATPCTPSVGVSVSKLVSIWPSSPHVISSRVERILATRICTNLRIGL